MFESQDEVDRAFESLWIDRYEPDVFKLLPDFTKYDPTSEMPEDIRRRALRMSNRKMAFQTTADVSGTPSVVSSHGGAVLGSVLWIILDRPLEHALRLFYVMTKAKSTVDIAFDPLTSDIVLNDPTQLFGLRFGASADDWTTQQLLESINTRRPIGLAFARTAAAHEQMLRREHVSTGDNISLEIFAKQNVGDWYLVNTRGGRVIRYLDGRAEAKDSDHRAPPVSASPYDWFQQQMAAAV